MKNRLAQFTPCSNCSPKSRFEQMLLALISERYSGPLVQNSKPLRTDAGARMELDFWLPELRLGFEMQDFATHSRDSDEEPSAFAFRGELHKKGPTYHSLKRELTRDQLNGLLVEIWEDQLRSTAAGLKLETALASAKRRVSE